MIFHGCNQWNKEDHNSSFTGTGDKRGHVQRHVALTNKVTRDSYCVELDIFDIFDLKNLHNKKIIALASLEQEIRQVTLMVTWPRRTRSRVIVTVTLNTTFLIFSSSEARVMIFLVSLVTPMKNHRSCFSGTSDEKGQAQFHLTLIYKVTLDSYSVELYFFEILHPKNLPNKRKIIAFASLEHEIRKVTLMVTWLWRTRSRVIVGMWNYIFLTSLTLKTCKTKKKIIALASLEQEIRKVTLMVTWPWRTRSRVIVAVWNYIFLTSLTLKTCKTKKDHHSCVIRTKDKESHV